ncbi:MAG: hypothetical protein HYX89_05865 [Chloroflexi bacterium]|nr:hypothetical protein [Chloroflexota bacterium]
METDFDPRCPLCLRHERTRKYHEDDLVWIVDCEICYVPMAVLKRHTMRPTSEERQHVLNQLGTLAAKLPDEGWHTDDVMRRIPDHYHVHLRPDWWPF